MTALELEQIKNHISNIPAVATLYVPQLINEIEHLQHQIEEATNERNLAIVEAASQDIEITRLRVELKGTREKPIPKHLIYKAMIEDVFHLRSLVLENEWVTDGRESIVYCLWCKQTANNGHAKDCEMFGPNGAIPTIAGTLTRGEA